MDTNRIMNEIDNVENQEELAQALDIIIEDIAHQLSATVTAMQDNPYVVVPTAGDTLEAMLRQAGAQAVALLKAG